MKQLESLTPEKIRALGSFKAILLDLDDTVAPVLSGRVEAGMIQRLKTLQEAGYQLGIVSNNFHQKYCEKIHQTFQDLGLQVHFLGNARKPGSQGYKAMLERMGVSAKEALMVGDSRLGDVWGGNRMGITTIRAQWYTASGFRNWKICRLLRELADWAWTGLRRFFSTTGKPVWISGKTKQVN